MTLLDNGWTEEQAHGLLQSLNLDGGTPKWKREHLQRLRSWCSAHKKDSTTVDGHLSSSTIGFAIPTKELAWL